jgi:hypothetical protein
MPPTGYPHVEDGCLLYSMTATFTVMLLSKPAPELRPLSATICVNLWGRSGLRCVLGHAGILLSTF